MAYNQNYMSNIGSGASTGAAIGSVVPGVGTAIGAGVGAIGGLALSVAQNRAAKKQMARDEANRPKYQIPGEVKAALSIAEQQALEGLPEEQKRQFVSNLNQSAQFSLAQQSRRKGGLVGIPRLAREMRMGYSDLLSQDAAARQRNRQQHLQQLQNMANYRDQQFQLDKLNPYYEGIARREAQQGALYQNLSNSLQLGMYGINNMQGREPVSKAPIGTKTAYNMQGNPVSVAPGVSSSGPVDVAPMPQYETPTYAKLPYSQQTYSF